MAPRNEDPSEDWQVKFAEIRLRSAYLFRSRQWTDCSFKFETDGGAEEAGDTLEAHKLILAMASPVFAAMFYGEVGEKESPVQISDIDMLTFSRLLQYIYTDKAAIYTIEDAINLYKAANKYILVHLEKICIDYLSKMMDPVNVCQIYEFSCFFGKDSLEEKCLEMLRTKTQYVLKSPSFLNADVSTLKKIVSLDTLDINNELELHDAVLNFADNFKIPDKINKQLEEDDDDQMSNESSDDGQTKKSSIVSSINNTRQVLQGILEEIRFLSMTAADLAKVSETNKLLSVDEIRALFTNKFSSESNVPMPAWFSTIREPRFRHAATIRHTINVTSMKPNVRQLSVPISICDLSWKISMYRYQHPEEPLEEFLSLYLLCTEDDSIKTKDWYCYVKLEACIIPTEYKLGSSKILKFDKDNSSRGWNKFIKWNNLINPENKFIKDDTITIEMHFSTSPIQVAQFQILF
ncbi:BTB/POZ domain-containing protein [Phthorimaea operculella]|nr:BTB/POZ domain-containing protein [Phthorimaea operculella]